VFSEGVICIGRPDIPVLIKGESVRVREEPDAEALQKPACRIEFQNRRVDIASIETRGVAVRLIVETAVKNPNIAVRSDMHPDDLSPLVSIRTFHSRGNRRPIRHETIPIWKRGRFGDRRIPATLGVRHHGKSSNDDGDDRERSAYATWWHLGTPSEIN
jgi:hypothetical protein